MKSRKVKVMTLPITRHSHTRLRKPLEVDESRRRRREIRRGAKVPRWKVRKKKHKREKRRGDKEGRMRGGIRKPRSATAHLRIVMLTPAWSNNRHQAQWRNPCWKGGREVVEAESKGWGQSAGRETLSHYRIAAPRCRDSLCPYVNSCKQRFTPIQPWAWYRHPPCCFLSLSLFLSFAFHGELAKLRRVNGRRCPPPTLIFLVSIKIWHSLRISGRRFTTNRLTCDENRLR